MKNKIDKVAIVKILGLIMTIGGAIASNWAGGKENERNLKKFVEENQTKQ